MSLRAAFYILAGGMMAATTLVHGRWTGRWDAAVTGPLRELQSMQSNVGDWTGKPIQLEEDTRLMAGASDEWGMNFARTGGDNVSALLLAGRPGPLAAHTPDVCYPSSGYEMVASPELIRWTIDGREVQMRRAAFRKPGSPANAAVIVHWAWNDGTGWLAPDYPRVHFAGSRILYKLYLTHQGSATVEGNPPNPSEQLARDLLPHIERKLFAD